MPKAPIELQLCQSYQTLQRSLSLQRQALRLQADIFLAQPNVVEEVLMVGAAVRGAHGYNPVCPSTRKGPNDRRLPNTLAEIGTPRCSVLSRPVGGARINILLAKKGGQGVRVDCRVCELSPTVAGHRHGTNCIWCRHVRLSAVGVGVGVDVVVGVGVGVGLGLWVDGDL